jgi:hypothetical protein
MKIRTAGLFLLLVIAGGASSPVLADSHCQEMADKVTRKFEAEQKMSNIDKAAKCRAISLVISDLTDLAVACGADQKFRDERYMPLAKAIGDEAPKACPR